MLALYEGTVIHIDITNACINQCSNCTRFCGHHRKPFFMDWDTFKQAADSLSDFPGTVGIMGGEPTLHPEFERFVRYIAKRHPVLYKIGGGERPLPDFMAYLEDANQIKYAAQHKVRGLGLWSSLCGSYYRHYELIQDTFTFQALNDHGAVNRHQAILMSRREFGISDQEWIKLRDACWWQMDMGSPCITPKGCFFCEIAGALDMLFDGPGGWPVEPGWWKRGPKDFDEQLELCELCAMPFTTIDRNANEQVDDVSPMLYEMLERVGSPKLGKGAVAVHTKDGAQDGTIRPREAFMMYLDDDGGSRYQRGTLYPQRVVCCIELESPADIRNEALEKTANLFDELIILTGSEAVRDALGSRFRTVYRPGASQCALLLAAVQREKDWVVLLDAGQSVETGLRDIIGKTVFNPGTFHTFQHNGMRMFNVRAQAWRSAGYARISRMGTLDELACLWPAEKNITVEKGFERVINPDLARWREDVARLGLRDDGASWARYTALAARREIDPQISLWRGGEGDLADKLRALDAIRFKLTPPEGVTNKLRTAIHNLLAGEIGHDAANAERIAEALEGAQDSFCVQYALAMLSTGGEKEEHLVRCVLNPNNVYDLGLTTLKLHYDGLNPALNQEKGPETGVVQELIALASGKRIIILGNRYAGTSIAMLLCAAGLKPLAFADDERTYFSFQGIPTVFCRKLLKEHPDSPYLISEQGAVGSYLYSMLKKKGFSASLIVPHRMTLMEMNKVPIILEGIPREASSLYKFHHLVIPTAHMEEIRRLRRTEDYSVDGLREILS